MNTVTVSAPDDVDPAALLRSSAPALDPTPGTDVARPFRVELPDGTPVAVVDTFPGDLAAYRRAVLAYPMGTTFRAAGIRNTSAVFGSLRRSGIMHRTAAQSCAGSIVAPEAHAVLAGAASALAARFAALAPDLAAHDRGVVNERVHPDWMMGESWWTSGVLNRSSALAYHYDRNNHPVWNCMVVVRRHTLGGHLHVPRVGLVLPCADGDVAWFPAWTELHGVTPITARRRDGYRYSAVYYSVRGMPSTPATTEHADRIQ